MTCRKDKPVTNQRSRSAFSAAVKYAAYKAPRPGIIPDDPGRAGSLVRAEFDDREVSVGQDTTTLRVGLPDPAALWGIAERIWDSGSI
jgi:hypothetical protein